MIVIFSLFPRRLAVVNIVAVVQLRVANWNLNPRLLRYRLKLFFRVVLHGQRVKYQIPYGKLLGLVGCPLDDKVMVVEKIVDFPVHSVWKLLFYGFSVRLNYITD